MAGQQSLERMYPYHVTEFINVGRRPKIKKVDIVATKWMQYDTKRKKCVVRYPPPPYTSESYEAYNEMLYNLEDPPDHWHTYSVQIKGKAKTLEEAYRKLENLKENETSLTMNSEESSTEVERRAIDEIRQNKLQHIADSYKNTISQKSSSMNQDSLNSKSLHCQEKDSESTRSLSQGTNMSNRSMSMIEKPSGSKSLGSDCQETSSQSMHSQSQGTNMSSRSTSLIQKAYGSKSFVFEKTSSQLMELPAPEDINSVDLDTEDLQQETKSQNDKQSLRNDNTSNFIAGANARTKACPGAAKLSHEAKKIDNQTSNQFQRSPHQQFVTECFINLMSDVKEIKNDLKQMKLDLENLKSKPPQGTNSIINLKQLCEKYGYQIPFQNVEEFTNFDKALSTDKSLYEDVCTILKTCNDSTFVISRSIVNMLKMFLEKDVANKYVAVRKVKDKITMSKTTFYNCIEVTIRERRNSSNLETSEKEIISALSSVLSNSVSWHGSKKSDDLSKVPNKDSAKNLDNTVINNQLLVQANHASTKNYSAITVGSETEQDLPLIVIENVPINDDQSPQRTPLLTESQDSEFISFEEYLNLQSEGQLSNDDEDNTLDNYF